MAKVREQRPLPPERAAQRVLHWPGISRAPHSDASVGVEILNQSRDLSWEA